MDLHASSSAARNGEPRDERNRTGDQIRTEQIKAIYRTRAGRHNDAHFRHRADRRTRLHRCSITLARDLVHRRHVGQTLARLVLVSRYAQRPRGVEGLAALGVVVHCRTCVAASPSGLLGLDVVSQSTELQSPLCSSSCRDGRRCRRVRAYLPSFYVFFFAIAVGADRLAVRAGRCISRPDRGIVRVVVPRGAEQARRSSRQ